MERLLNDRWFFSEQPAGQPLPADTAFVPVDLPHDAMISDENDLYRSCDLWYKRILPANGDQLSKEWLLQFDGVYMDCDVLVNGEKLCTHHHGYTAFTVNLTPQLRAGDNELLVYIRHRSPNTRWYSGAGIFRDVTLMVLEPRHMVPDSVLCHTEHLEGNRWRLTVSCELTETGIPVTYRLLDRSGSECLVLKGDAFGFATAEMSDPLLWSCETPCWYTLEAHCPGQTISQRVGFREIRLTPDQGLFVNGNHVKLKGVCLHHDLGALGSAFNESAARRQLRIMQEMGVNALRTSHNPPARQVLDLCDELGILVDDEFTDMWHHPKTAYDYARFFDMDCRKDVGDWVRRDRNHPCVFMWSIGNEIPDTMENPYRADISTLLRDETLKHDRTRPVTLASNYMAWEGGQRCSEMLDAQGYNYAEKYYERHHREHPDWVIYGSETSSSLSTRGVYHFPMSANILSDEDLQCSALGNSATSWGTQDLQRCIYDDLNTPFSLGQFIWTGIDYIGEPTPYHTRSSYFGMVDTAGFPKDPYYRFQAGWSDKKMIHIGIYWSWNPGQMVDVPVMTNCPYAELFLNGVSLGRKKVSITSAKDSLPVWQVAYSEGVLTAVGYDGDGAELARDEQRSFTDASALCLTASDPCIRANGRDLVFVTVTAADKNGSPVRNAGSRVHLSVTGAGRLMGVDNGDSTDVDGYQTESRRLFAGKLLAIVGTTGEAGEIRIRASSPGLEDAELTVQAEPAEMADGISCSVALCREHAEQQDIPIREIRLVPLSSTRLNPGHAEVCFDVKVFPENADRQPLGFRVTNTAGITSPCGTVETDNGRVRVTGKGDGQLMLRASANNGADHPRILSVYPITVEGMGKPYLDPYHFVSAGLYDIGVEITAGNEQGISFSPDEESIVGFHHVDFGRSGSRKLTMPVFTLDSKPYDMEMFLGDPREGGTLITVLHYQKPSIWNVYQEETWELPVLLKGVHTICFRMHHKVHLKGFLFEEENRAWSLLPASGADQIYGDSFTVRDGAVCDIGNNVSLVWRGLDFGEAQQILITIDGFTPLEKNPITLHITPETGEERTVLLSFDGGARHCQDFPAEIPGGKCDLSFVFLPGSSFDFHSVQIKKA